MVINCRMKVILTQDVAKIGRRFEVVEVSDGYALNKLIPQHLAEPATPANLKRVEARSKKQAETVAHVAEEFHAAVAALKETVVEVEAEANAEGKLFQAVKPEMIAEAASEKAGVTVEAGWVHTPTPVKTTGEHTVLLSAGEDQGEFTITIVSK